jgi:hypothetical protein
MMRKYVKKPVEIEALQWTGDNVTEILSFATACFSYEKNGARVLAVATLEGTMTASVGDYIIKGVQGEFYPCKPEIFDLTYEEVTE